ncbi:MAG: bifunctional 3,4-dihydroxy-2-butanone-4-phosphate synthase/GTP cyclohydrolase II, partial [Corynebacterium casei]|nr:bifunctional 3,4-dihydroxy-2-butanone-4-phosphate synthase/GTP cyclohydrolase II [Corynebacterium casei]
EGLRGFGVDASNHTSIEVEPNEDNIDYLRTKRDRMNHVLPQVARWDAEHQGK